MSTTVFVQQSVEKKLAELRYNCGLQRLHLRNAYGPRWSGCQRRNPDKPDSWEKYWEDLQAAAQLECQKDVEQADKALADFIVEHRQIMGEDWIGNNHGRLCWSPYLGGCPIDHHYCQLPESHEGQHSNTIVAWPQGVTNEHERYRVTVGLPL